jgi:hypothetical protein
MTFGAAGARGAGSALAGRAGVMEIDLPEGVRVRVDGGVDEMALRWVLSAVRRFAGTTSYTIDDRVAPFGRSTTPCRNAALPGPRCTPSRRSSTTPSEELGLLHGEPGEGRRTA